MKSVFVSATTRVRPSRVHNIDTERLVRRLLFLRANRAHFAREADGRNRLGHFAREFLTIEAELVHRGVDLFGFRARTMKSWRGDCV